MRLLVLIALYCCYGFIPKSIPAKLNILKIPNNENINNENIISNTPISFINNSIKNDTDGGIAVTLPKDPPKFPTLTLSNIAFLFIEQ
jgi:hypothetical protein